MTARTPSPLALLPLLLLTACNARPVPGGGYHVNDLPPEQRRVLATPRFEQYPPYRIMGTGAVPLEPAGRSLGTDQRAALRDGAARGVAFAGEVAVASWACGTGCRQWALIDAQTGTVTLGPRTAGGAAFQRDSRLFVAEPTAAPQDRRYFIWTGKELKPLEG